MAVKIIAEAGASHGGDLDRAVDLVYAAQIARADIVKFQVWKTDKFVAKTSPFYNSFALMEMKPMHWEYIKGHCDAAGIEFMASAFDEESVDMLDAMGVKAFKVASGDLTHEPLIRHIAKRRKHVYLSTGMATQEEIIRTTSWLGNRNLTLMKCTVDYPCGENDVNLLGMNSLKEFVYPVGLSDHTKGHLAGCMAVAMGATVIEKHFALKETDDAIGAKQFTQWVEQIRTAEMIMGSGELGVKSCEEKWFKVARRGESGLRE